MMISYFHLLLIGSSGQPVLHDHPSYLFHLVRLRLATLWLEIQDLLDAVLREDMMIPADALTKAQTPQ